MKKTYLIVAAILAALLFIVAGVFAICFLHNADKKKPRKPGEAELWAAEKFIGPYLGKEASGNTPEAIAFAEVYSEKLKTSSEPLFAKGWSRDRFTSNRRFMTYCFQKDDSLAVLLHVTGSNSASKMDLSKLAWTLATTETRERFPNIKYLAFALKTGLSFRPIFTGTIAREGDPLEGILESHPRSEQEALWPFFDSTRPTR